MGFKKWCVLNSDKQLAKELAYECDTDPIVALIASARGYCDSTDLELFLTDEPCFSDPYELADISVAAECINFAVENGEKIAIFGDYDCDGVVSVAILYRYLLSRNAEVIYYIPDRFEEGYGMNKNAVKTLADKGVKLIVTVDNGISCFDEIEYANSLGVKVVVTDHHLPPEVLPNAVAVVDPHRKDCPSSFKQICGAQVAFKLICVLEGKEPEELIYDYADQLSLAVIADVMPLYFENRSIVKCGINKLKTAPLVGLSALLNVAGIAVDSANSSRITYGLSPRINAAGRMGNAARAVELLLCDNIMTALQIANEIDDENSRRQQVEKQILNEAVEIIENKGYKYDRVIVVSGKNWHSGVVGIVASRLTERYGAPAFVISENDELSHGSGRSLEGFSLYDALRSTDNLLIKFGGHSLAAGLTLKTENIENFRKAVNAYAAELPYTVPVLKLDCRLNPAALTLDFTESLKVLEPFGAGNSTPVFGIFGVTLQRITPIAQNKHLRLLFTKGENSFQALLFGVTPQNFCFCVGDVLDIAVTAETNYYNGSYSVSVQIKALRTTGIDDEFLFNQIDNYNKFCAQNGEYSAQAILPTRQQVGEIYKLISQNAVLPERVKYLFINTIGYAKTKVAFSVLTELGLIRKNKNGLLEAVENAPKTDLKNSATYKTLLKESESL